MVIGSINVNSLLLHIDEVRELITDKGFHILSINETKLDSTIADNLLGVMPYIGGIGIDTGVGWLHMSGTL